MDGRQSSATDPIFDVGALGQSDFIGVAIETRAIPDSPTSVRQTTLPLAEVGLIAGTRGMLGAGAGLLLANRIRPRRRMAIGWPLFLIGALSTVPLVIDVIRKSRPCAKIED